MAELPPSRTQKRLGQGGWLSTASLVAVALVMSTSRPEFAHAQGGANAPPPSGPGAVVPTARPTDIGQSPPAQTVGEVQAQSEASTKPAGSVEEVVVTASRVARSGFTAPTPTTFISSADLDKTGTTNVADLLNQIPSFGNSTTPATTSVSTQQAGGNYLNLRDLGTTRTLVLIDGLRHVPTTATGLIDINVIPTGIIDHVEVVTGGASAAWGSDAVAGVVNLILKKDLEGLQGELEAGESDRSDFSRYKADFTYGAHFLDRGRFVASVEIADDNGSGPGNTTRDWVNAGYQRIANPAYTATNGQAQTLIASNVHVSVASLGGLITSGPLKGTQFGPGGTTSTFNYGTQVGGNYMVGGDGVNLGRLFNSLQVPLKRYSFFSRASFQITPSIEAWAESSAAYSQSIYDISSSYDLGTIKIQRTNAYLPSNIYNLMAADRINSFTFGRINSDLAANIVDDTNSTQRFVVGLDGTFWNKWKWNASYEYGQTRYASEIFNNRINANFTNAVDAVVNPATGQVVCRSTLTAPTNGCVPINLFGPGTLSSAALNYVVGNQRLVNWLSENAAALDVQGEPFSIWAGPVSVAAGFDYRKETTDQRVDANSIAGVYNLGNPKPLDGAYHVKEGYGETVVPLLSGLPFVKSLDFNGAVRYTEYSNSGGVTTWKLGLTYSVNSSLRFRATQSRDIRAPNLSELYSSTVLTFSTVIDPLNNQQATIQSPSQGNPNLKPERADTTTWGVIFEPTWLRGLRASVDVYNIVINGAISTLTAQQIVTRCYQGNTALCQFVQRDASGLLSRNAVVTRAYVNLNELKTDGVDLEVDYATPLSRFASFLDGSLSLRFLGSFVDHIITNDGVTLTNYGGDVGSDVSGLPHWRWNLSGTYDRGPVTLFAQGRYIGGGAYDSSAPNLVSPNKVSSQFVVDASLQYRISSGPRHALELFLNVNNVFDKDPPIDPSTYIISNATNKALYDFEGRRFLGGIRFKY